jgi:hypothetical protein
VTIAGCAGASAAREEQIDGVVASQIASGGGIDTSFTDYIPHTKNKVRWLLTMYL